MACELNLDWGESAELTVIGKKTVGPSGVAGGLLSHKSRVTDWLPASSVGVLPDQIWAANRVSNSNTIAVSIILECMMSLGCLATQNQDDIG